jgi:hypothetical protein
MELEIKYSSKGEKLKMLIDDEDYNLIKSFCINPIEGKLTTGSRTPYAITRKTINKKRKQFYIHRLVMGILDNPSIHIDHINGNTIDNRKENLRIVTRSQNMKNRSSSVNGTSKFLGVYYCSNKRGGKKWRAVIKPSNDSNIHLGYYSDEYLGAYAYNIAAKVIHGEYANLNDIDIFNCSSSNFLIGGNNNKDKYNIHLNDIKLKVMEYLSNRGFVVGEGDGGV